MDTAHDRRPEEDAEARARWRGCNRGSLARDLDVHQAVAVSIDELVARDVAKVPAAGTGVVCSDLLPEVGPFVAVDPPQLEPTALAEQQPAVSVTERPTHHANIKPAPCQCPRTPVRIHQRAAASRAEPTLHDLTVRVSQTARNANSPPAPRALNHTRSAADQCAAPTAAWPARLKRCSELCCMTSLPAPTATLSTPRWRIFARRWTRTVGQASESTHS